jgi:hypothetical protein
MGENKSSRRLWLLLPALMWGVLTATAQTATNIVINNPQVIEEDGAVRLNVYFTVTDDDGRAVTDANLDSSGTLQIVGDSIAYEAEIAEADSPLYIALVLDASGSMDEAMGDLRAAAVAAIDAAPPEANVGVFQFNEPQANGQTLQMIQDFSTDHQAVKAGIGLAQSGNNLGTCIYYAANEAVAALRAATHDRPDARRAVILFTDGFDEKTTGQRDTCSINTTVDQVIAGARATSGATGNDRVHLYTIGMAGENQVDETTLRRFADETGGLAAIGSQADLGGHFRSIMEGLAHQWVATALVRPAAGKHQATLVVNLQDDNAQPGAEPTELSDTFEFESPCDCSVAEPSVALADWLKAENKYLVNVTSPQRISRLLLVVRNDGGAVERLTIAPLDPSTDAQYAVPTYELYEIGQTYQVNVHAFDSAGDPILKNDDNVLYSFEFTYDPPATPTPAPPIVRIVDVVADPDRREFTISLDARNTGAIREYRISLYNEDLKAAIPAFTMPPPANDRLYINLEDKDAEPGSYTVSIMPLDDAGEPLVAEEINYQKPITYSPAEPTQMEQLGQSFRENPWIPGLIAALILGLVALLAFRAIQKSREGAIIFTVDNAKKNARSPLKHRTNLFGRQNPPNRGAGKVAVDRPPSRPPVIAPPAADPPKTRPTPPAAAPPAVASPAAPAPALLLYVTQSPDARLQGTKVEVTSFPFIIGRENANLNINDPRMSRRHIQLTRDGDQVYVTDPGSSNGTFIAGSEQRLQVRTPYKLNARNRLRIGSTHISIELRP